MKAERSVLIVGGNGFIGSALARDLARDFKVYATFNTRFVENRSITHLPMNMNDKDSAKRAAFLAHPQTVIFCGGAYDWVDAEKDEKRTQAIHAGAPGNVMTASEIFKPKFIYISSDLVFSGKEGNFHEEDTALPFLALGKAQVAAENYVRSKSLNHVVIRCSDVLGRGPVDHPSWWDKLRVNLAKGQIVKLSSKMVHNPAPVQSVVEAVRKVIHLDIKNKNLHIGGLTRVSEYELGQLLAKRYGFNPALIQENEAQNVDYDFSLNFSETLNLIKTTALTIDQALECMG